MNPQQAGGPVSYNSSSGKRGNIIVTVLLVILLLAALGFGGWAFTQMQDYKTKSDQKSAAAVAAANKQLTAQLQAQFAGQSKSPNKTFHGSPTYGSLTFDYPKTWSAYVDTSNTSEPINGYFHPDTVPGLQSKTAYALRAELLQTDYAQAAAQYNSLITSGKITSKAYIPPKMAGAANVSPGLYLSGQVNSSDSTQNGTMVLIKVRDKTLKIYTESNEYLKDFNNILNSLTFSP